MNPLHLLRQTSELVENLESKIRIPLKITGMLGAAGSLVAMTVALSRISKSLGAIEASWIIPLLAWHLLMVGLLIFYSLLKDEEIKRLRIFEKMESQRAEKEKSLENRKLRNSEQLKPMMEKMRRNQSR